MYNSRPRYQRYTSEISVPENYSGNAFRDEPAEKEEKNESVDNEIADVPKKVEEKSDEELAVMSAPQKKRGRGASFGLDISRLFKGGIGFEELLILGLILLVSQDDGNDDVVLLLALLLFVG